ncbi:MAG: hypothetical protein ACO4BW_00410 [Nitriliruptoraceae bacterium]
MTGRDEAQAAYFALLRAREEQQLLARHEEYLHAELRRLRRTTAEERALRDAAPPGPRRPLRASDEAFEEVVDRRVALLEDELERLPARLAAAAAFVEECERTSRLLGRG